MKTSHRIILDGIPHEVNSEMEKLCYNACLMAAFNKFLQSCLGLYFCIRSLFDVNWPWKSVPLGKQFSEAGASMKELTAELFADSPLRLGFSIRAAHKLHRIFSLLIPLTWQCLLEFKGQVRAAFNCCLGLMQSPFLHLKRFVRDWAPSS